MDFGEDLEQPHNFVTINAEIPDYHMMLEYIRQPDYALQYEWINGSALGLNQTWFDYFLSKREFQEVSTTTVIINSSTAKLRMEFLKKDLSFGNNNAKQQLKPLLLILDQAEAGYKPKKLVRLFNILNGSGKFNYCSVINIKNLAKRLQYIEPSN